VIRPIAQYFHQPLRENFGILITLFIEHNNSIVIIIIVAVAVVVVVIHNDDVAVNELLGVTRHLVESRESGDRES